MNAGQPKIITTEVENLEEDVDKLRGQAHVLWAGSGIDHKLYVNTCAEELSAEICGGCVAKDLCSFSKAVERG